MYNNGSAHNTDGKVNVWAITNTTNYASNYKIEFLYDNSDILYKMGQNGANVTLAASSIV